MLILNTLPAANGSRNMKARLEPLSRSIWKQKTKYKQKKGAKKNLRKSGDTYKLYLLVMMI